jgi:hypothetical protein
MSLNENQIKQLVREEVRRIFDAGLLYTETCKIPEKQPPTPAPLKPTTTTATVPETIMHLTDFTKEGNETVIKPKHFLQTTDFAAVNNWVFQQHGTYVKATPDTPGHWRIP